MVPGPHKRLRWFCLALLLLAMMLISPLPPSLANSSMPGHRSHIALKCLVGSYCGDEGDMML